MDDQAKKTKQEAGVSSSVIALRGSSGTRQVLEDVICDDSTWKVLA